MAAMTLWNHVHSMLSAFWWEREFNNMVVGGGWAKYHFPRWY